MKAVLLAVIGLLAISVQAQDSCNPPAYTEDIVPVCLQGKPGVRLPYYADITMYYNCTTMKPVLYQCKQPTGYFTNVFQECTTCADYLPAAPCSDLTMGLKCQAIAAETTKATTVATTKSTTVTTPKTTASTTTAFPGPPVDGTTSSPGPSDGSTGTTIAVPQPPSPNDPNVPAPPTPAPTVGTIATGPPVAP